MTFLLTKDLLDMMGLLSPEERNGALYLLTKYAHMHESENDREAFKKAFDEASTAVRLMAHILIVTAEE